MFTALVHHPPKRNVHPAGPCLGPDSQHPLFIPSPPPGSHYLCPIQGPDLLSPLSPPPMEAWSILEPIHVAQTPRISWVLSRVAGQVTWGTEYGIFEVSLQGASIRALVYCCGIVGRRGAVVSPVSLLPLTSNTPVLSLLSSPWSNSWAYLRLLLPPGHLC